MPPSGGSQTAQLWQESLGNVEGNESGPPTDLTGNWRCNKGLSQAPNRSLFLEKQPGLGTKPGRHQGPEMNQNGHGFYKHSRSTWGLQFGSC